MGVLLATMAALYQLFSYYKALFIQEEQAAVAKEARDAQMAEKP